MLYSHPCQLSLPLQASRIKTTTICSSSDVNSLSNIIFPVSFYFFSSVNILSVTKTLFYPPPPPLSDTITLVSHSTLPGSTLYLLSIRIIWKASTKELPDSGLYFSFTAIPCQSKRSNYINTQPLPSRWLVKQDSSFKHGRLITWWSCTTDNSCSESFGERRQVGLSKEEEEFVKDWTKGHLSWKNGIYIVYSILYCAIVIYKTQKLLPQ